MITALLITLHALGAFPEAAHIFDQANKAYTAERYAEAADGYKQLTTLHSINNPALLFNLANACYKQGQLGNAVLYYEAALAVDPAFEAARSNLEKVLGETRRSLPLPDPRQITGSLLLRYYPLTPRQSLWLVHAFLAAAIVFLLLRQWRTRPRYAVSLWISLCLAALFYGLSLGAGYALRSTPKLAVARTKEVPVYFSMNESEQPRFLLYEGDRVFVDRQEGEWVRLHAYGGERGWTRKDAIGIVEYGIW
jgi:tetratricopeptide (TPR) repeat protein